jgi:hypothetical protein
MKYENKLPYVTLYAADMLTIMNSFCAITRGVLFTLICQTWARKCEWVSVEEARQIAKSYKVTNKQFEKVKKELSRFVAKDVFKFGILEEMMNEAIEKGIKNKRNADKRWAKVKENEMRSQCNTDSNTKSDSNSSSNPKPDYN